MPVVFGVVSLGVLAASLVRHDSALVQAMAITALGLVIGRMCDDASRGAPVRRQLPRMLAPMT